MSIRRLGIVYRLELLHYARRPLFWVMLLLIVALCWGFSTGEVQIRSGDSAVGGTKAWVTSEFAVAMLLPSLVLLVYSFFIAVIAGMSIIQDDEQRVSELLHATPLTPREYAWGKFLAVLTGFLTVLCFQLLASAFFNHLVPSATAEQLRGPFDVWNYVIPGLAFALPTIIFFAGTSFFVGVWSRRPILIFVLPVATLLGSIFLWTWAPTWLDPRIDRILMLVDPAGFRWLNQTWLKVDRGVDFYNHARIDFDMPFLGSRLVFVFLGLLGGAVAERQVAAAIRGHKIARRLWRLSPVATAAVGVSTKPLAALGMSSAAPGWLRSLFEVARIELRELRGSPGLYLFAPLILIQVIGTGSFAIGAFDTYILLTPGNLAAATFNTLTLLLCLLLLFYTVESVERERRTNVSGIHYATPAPTSAILAGKAIANSMVGVVILTVAWLGCVILLLVQGKVPVQTWPFVLVWGLLAVPTFLLWTSFVTAVLALTGNRYTTYSLALAALSLTGYLQFTKHMNWVGNWDLWDAVRWSDLSVFELNRSAFVLNRLFVLGLAVFFTALAVRLFPRREFDPIRIIQRLGPLSLVKTGWRLLPYAAAPCVIGVALYLEVYQGYGGDSQKKAQKDYWRKNLATWKDALLPAITAIDIDCDLQPDKGRFQMKGSFALRNHHDKPLAQVPVTGSPFWENLTWTLDDAEYKPEFREHLYVFTPPQPLPAGGVMHIGFSYEGEVPKGISKNGAGSMEFIEPGGVVLTSFTPLWVPVLGYIEEIGVDDDNHYESKVYPPGWYEGITEPLFGSSTTFTTRIRATAPEAYTINSVGTCLQNEVKDGRRTVVWESDEPVRFFNLVAGRWAVRKGAGTAIYYDPRHPYNVDEMLEGLEAARRYYSEWFFPYPWRELKLSEFPNLADYAQGFPTNITFSEGIGFLTKSDARTNAAFVIAAHESAHQWWGNILTPGKGPGGNILAEGMAHFSTILLCAQVKGLQARIEFCKRIEERYGENRRKDSERALNKIDGDREGDTTVTYDRGGWVFWMLLCHMGRERDLAGLHAFIDHYRLNLDHPVLEDFVTGMRPFAADPAAFDAFVNQWIFDTVVPEYQLSEPQLTQGGSSASAAWTVTVRIENTGTGKMPIDVAAVQGERFTDDAKPNPEYLESRTQIVLGAGEAKSVILHCPFKPEKVLVDPDALVLQLKRKLAIVRF